MKSRGSESKLSFMAHVLMENRKRAGGGHAADQSTGKPERESAWMMV
ncbi:MAG: hypothetical protein ABSB35_25590 [Bryobacteraceae bacterium]